jgi:hypothetical protein
MLICRAWQGHTLGNISIGETDNNWFFLEVEQQRYDLMPLYEATDRIV